MTISATRCGALTHIAALGSNPDKVAKNAPHQFLPYTPEQFVYDLGRAI